MSLLFFQNFGFAFARFIVSVLLTCVAFVSPRARINKQSLGQDLLTLFVIKSVIIISYTMIELLTSNNFAVIKDIVATSIFEVIALVYFHISRTNDVLLGLDKIGALTLILGGSFILYLSAELRSNLMVRDLGVSGNDNRFVALIICIFAYWLVIIDRRWFTSAFLFGLVFYITFLINARGAQISLLLISFFWVSSLLQLKVKQLSLLCLGIFMLFNISYFLSIVALSDPSSIERLARTQYVLTHSHLTSGLSEPHFVSLSFFQIFSVFSPVIFIFLFYRFHPVVTLVTLINFSFSSEIFTQIFVLNILIFDRIIKERSTDYAKI